jgi:hypothetical protein
MAKTYVVLFTVPMILAACSSAKTTAPEASWDCHSAEVPLGRTTECTSSVASALGTDDGPVTDGPAYVCPLGVVDADCPPPSAAATASFGDAAAEAFFCTREDGKRTCKQAPTCDPGAHRQQMDCEPDQSSGLGAGAGTPGGGGYAGAGLGDHSMPGAQMQCFYPVGAPPATTTPAATFEYVLEAIQGVDQLHVRLTFSPHFVDNSYGAASIGWAKGHQFKELVGSDHAELAFFDTTNTEKLHFKLDYISASASAPSGYASLGVTGGEGRMILGDAASILKASSSLDRNLNERGYRQFVVDSPPSDAAYTAPAAAPNWDFRVVYEAWIANAAFGPNGYSKVNLAFVHASPSKANSNTLPVEPGACPPDWGTPTAPSPSSPSTGGTSEPCTGTNDNPEVCPAPADPNNLH